MELISINPKNKQVLKKFDELSDEQIKKKLEKAQLSYCAWRQKNISERTRIIGKTADILRNEKTRLAKIITDEVGKTLAASEAEIEKCAVACEYYANNSANMLKPEIIKTDASQSFARFDPIGVILAIMPWNFPFWQVFRFAAPALCAGNAGVLKHAANVQLSAAAIEQVFLKAGLPESCFTNLAIKTGKVERVINDPIIKAVTLTGSEKAGSIVASQAGRELKKTVMELGGSDPFIVLAGADIAAAAKAAAIVRMQYNAGQSCISGKRFIVEETIFEKFLSALKNEVSNLIVGDPMDPKTHVGPLANQKMFESLDQQVKESVKVGAKLILGGPSRNKSGYYYDPAIVICDDINTPVLNEETFGPVFALISVKDYKEAIEVANASQYGLGATIFSDNADYARDNIAPMIESGAVFINGPVKSDPRLPFGGVKNSGYGRELSHYGLKEFVNVKTIWIK